MIDPMGSKTREQSRDIDIAPDSSHDQLVRPRRTTDASPCDIEATNVSRVHHRHGERNEGNRQHSNERDHQPSLTSLAEESNSKRADKEEEPSCSERNHSVVSGTRRNPGQPFQRQTIRQLNESSKPLRGQSGNDSERAPPHHDERSSGRSENIRRYREE
jgi:hypothetical protein